MKLLISAYACAPGLGSEHAVGWNWATEAHRLGHQVWVLASSAHRAAVEAACRDDAELAGINWVFPEIRGWPLRPATEPEWERSYNLLWQRKAVSHARDLQRRVGFDAIHHLTWAGIRAPTFLGALGPPLIIGPVGGGETSPRLLRDGFASRGRVLEELRDLSNATITVNPMVRRGLRDAAVIFASTADTRNLFTGALREKTLIFSQLALSEVRAARPRPSRPPRRLLYAGRLLYWKGIHIAIDAFARLAARVADASFTIVGDGPERERLQAQAAALNVGDRVDFITRLPQEELFELYDSHDLLLFPSLHDSGGFVVLEAMSHGLPVVCLDLGGPGEMVTAESGVVVATAGRTSEQVAAAAADAMAALLASPERLAVLSAGAIARANQFVRSDRVAQFYAAAVDFIGARRQHGREDALAAPEAAE